ncbi:DUF7446 family protein [Mycobacteroides abscessus]|uniref:DUF7446 family protein n=1 Tax=Mycobacteroides abscessus TaxID=36809 RepID=UPI0003A763C6|nr:hypothetical protein [Mycobacteroides abscessus]MBN7379321.1 hypothetical protein [Mycobacteroides abscessus subsp. massiliense]MDO2972720.1 hypothetical protein [Mycobacteroides abscessus subsp. bolletii]MDO3081007.1 hypothetical protein [Mycobacteroides abscessus subsp. bolletii]SIE27597.1 Uncharacterised protein [Mycobacteroides abscessus subsp. abscessus]SIK15203.1 Uncharacterised protein [Mycobacteroides abscessus subsp. abscessus]
MALFDRRRRVEARIPGDFEGELSDLAGQLGVVWDEHTNRIFVGTFDDEVTGLVDVQQDVTRTATAAVAAFVHARGGAVEITTDGFVYQVQVAKIVSPGAHGTRQRERP